jgi:uncharacterized MAPEG superfamily protein
MKFFGVCLLCLKHFILGQNLIRKEEQKMANKEQGNKKPKDNKAKLTVAEKKAKNAKKKADKAK